MVNMSQQSPTAAKSRAAPYDRTQSSSSMESFTAENELARLEARLNMKIPATGMSKPVATPSRAVGKGPVPVPSCGGVKVGTKQTHGGTKSNMAPMVNPSSAHSTPIKSPEQKKMRPSSVGTDDSSVRRNLTPALTKIEPESQPEETSAHVAPSSHHSADHGGSTGIRRLMSTSSLGGTPASPPQPAEDGGGKIRSLATATTIPLGHVSNDELDAALAEIYDKELWKVLFLGHTHESDEIRMSSLFGPLNHWCARRKEVGDIDTMDPALSEKYSKVLDAAHEFEEHGSHVHDSAKALSDTEGKLDAASTAMLNRQEQLVGKGSAHYQVHVRNINVWKEQKLDVAKKGHLIVLDQLARSKQKLQEAREKLIWAAYDQFSKVNNFDDSSQREVVDKEIDDGLAEMMGELESIVNDGALASQASSAAVPADPPQSPDQRLADQRDVMAYQGVEESSPGPTTPHLRAHTALITRKDTTQLEASANAKATTSGTTNGETPPSAHGGDDDDGETFPTGPGGRLETRRECELRVAVNAKMRFHRSLQSGSCPKAVLEKAKNRRYNRQIIGELFEAWLTSGQDWLRSSIVINSSRTQSERRRGRYVMCDYRSLKQKFGNALARQLRDEKKALEENKSSTDETCYWMKHPDVQHEDFELIRIFDSMVFESETNDEVTAGVSARGALDSAQTREVMQAAVGTHMTQFQSNGVHLQASTQQTPPPAPEKKRPPLSKQISNKISNSSSKLTEIMAWHSKVRDCTTLSKTLLEGFATELDARKSSITNAKGELECIYAQTLGKPEKDVIGNPELYEKITTQLANVDAAFTSLNGTLKSIKTAIEPKPEKVAKAKAKVAPAPKAAA